MNLEQFIDAETKRIIFINNTLVAYITGEKGEKTTEIHMLNGEVLKVYLMPDDD